MKHSQHVLNIADLLVKTPTKAGMIKLADMASTEGAVSIIEFGLQTLLANPNITAQQVLTAMNEYMARDVQRTMQNSNPAVS